MKYLRYITVFVVVCSLMIIPSLVFAVDDYGLGAAAPTQLKSTDDPAQFVGRLIQGFLAIVGLIFLILTVYGGAKYMMARGDTNAAQKARDIIFNALTGLIIVFASYALASFIITVVTSK